MLMQRLLYKIKGKDFTLDQEIPTTYLVAFYLSKLLGVLYGVIRLRTFKLVCIHPSAIIKCSSKLKFGSGLHIERGCYIDALSKDGLTFGKNCSLGLYTTIKLTGTLRQLGNRVTIGDNVGLGSHGFYGCGKGVLEIGNDCIFGNYVSIHPENHITESIKDPIRLQGVFSKGGVKIGNNCWIGAKVTILDGTVIGNGCIVAAGAVVSGTFPDHAVIGGVPAKIIRYRV